MSHALVSGEQTRCSTTLQADGLNLRRTVMNTIMIKDLSVTEELDSRALAAVRGGVTSLFPPGYGIVQSELSFAPQQIIGQSQNTMNYTGTDVAFSKLISSTVKPTQIAGNYNSFEFS
jgi:hypothetical protein